MTSDTLDSAKSREQAFSDIESGKTQIIIGTQAIADIHRGFTFMKGLLTTHDRSRFIASIDSKDGQITVKGWTENAGLSACDYINAADDYFWGYLYTDVSVEGQMSGINEAAVAEVTAATALPVIISGGVSSPEDAAACQRLGAWGTVVGKALYEGRMALNPQQ